MAQLKRIILLHTHLPGVVELDLSGHTNICGTNASGKTTLQRLVPVFYGEHPNRVVPKTRDRFDVFYLPHQNSYLIYEYEAAQGLKHVVLTKRADGVDYRFVDAPYQSELYINAGDNGIAVLEYPAWAQRLRDEGIASSHKISATSEYRAILQNDLSALRGQRKDQLKLRQLAARYALVGGHERLRHIEKLVSAVHAKEGKMDTLKSMLATILEEDGYQRPELSIKPAKIRAWVKEMRQFMGIDELQQQYQAIESRRSDIAAVEQLLWQLKPLLDEDKRSLRISMADLEADISRCKSQRDELEQAYEVKRNALNDSKHEAYSQYQQLNRDIEQAESKRERFLQSGIEQVEQDIKSLPVWQQDVEEKGRHLALMLEKNEDIAHKLEQRKNQLAENLDRLQRKNQQASEEVRQQQSDIRDQQAETIAHLQQQQMQAQQAAQEKQHEQLRAMQSEAARLQAQLDVEPLTQDEREKIQLAEARIDASQHELEQAQAKFAQTEKTWLQCKTARQESDQRLVHARAQYHKTEQKLMQLKRQMNPEQGSLRHFLREHHAGWQHHIGKVIAEPLLERTDLNPGSSEQTLSLFGLTLDLGAIEQPEHAVDEGQIQAVLEQTDAQLGQEQAHVTRAEHELEQSHQAVQQAEQAQQQARQTKRRVEQDLEYARDAKKRLQSELQQLVQRRQQAHRERLAELAEEESVLTAQYTQKLDTIRHDFKSLELEHRADFQEQFDKLAEDLALYQRQVDDMRASNKAQIKELEKQVHQELAAAGVDAKRLAELKQEVAALQERISKLKDRRHELSEYQDFIASVWTQQRPQWLNQAQQSKQRLEQAETQLSELKSEFEQQRQSLRQEEKQLQEKLHQQQQFASKLEEQLQRFKVLLAQDEYQTEGMATEASAEDFGDINERIERLTEGLNHYQQGSRQLKEQCERFAGVLRRNASSEFEALIEREYHTLGEAPGVAAEASLLGELLAILQDQRSQVVEQGRNIGGGLQSFFKVFDDVNRKVGQYSRRLTEVVGDELALEGIQRSEVVISSTVDELGFWQPLKQLSQLYVAWSESGELMPSETYLDRLSEVADLLRSDQEYSFESLLKLELHLNERGSELIIRNDRQLLESSSHGMAYLILCKFLLAFTRLLRGDSKVVIHWPIDEIGTLAYHNVERLFHACDSNQIQVVGAFPNPESDVLLLFKHRYLIEPHKDKPGKGQLKRIQPRVSPLGAKLAQKLASAEEVTE